MRKPANIIVTHEADTGLACRCTRPPSHMSVSGRQPRSKCHLQLCQPIRNLDDNTGWTNKKSERSAQNVKTILLLLASPIALNPGITTSSQVPVNAFRARSFCVMFPRLSQLRPLCSSTGACTPLSLPTSFSPAAFLAVVTLLGRPFTMTFVLAPHVHLMYSLWRTILSFIGASGCFALPIRFVFFGNFSSLGVFDE